MKQNKILLMLISFVMMMSSCSTDETSENEEKGLLPVPTYQMVPPDNGLLNRENNADILGLIKSIISDTSKGDNFKKVKVEYYTPDQDNNPVKVSAIITIPNDTPITKVYLVNHGTHFGDLMIPSKGIFVEESIASSGALCIFPDYIGLGSSEDHPELYLNAEVQGTTSVDALLVLLDYAKQQKLNLKENFETYVIGYSQGGAASLATLRQIQRMPQNQQDLLHLKKVYCGDGPYDLRSTFETYISDYEQGKDLGLPAVIPMVLSSMFHSYADETKNISYKNLFTTKAWLSGVPKAIYDNDANLIDVMAKWMGYNLGDVLNMKYIESHPEEFELMLNLMQRQDLTTGWEPHYPVRFFHANPDGIVPFSNYEAAERGLKNKFFESEVVPGDPDAMFLKQHGFGMRQFIQNATNGNF